MNFADTSEWDMILRLFLSFLAGGFIGLERSSRRQVAGLRTHILIAVGSCLLMLLSIWVSRQFSSGDPGRIAAQVVSGIGFLGAGAIIRLGNNIKGLTTAASLWLIAAVGLALGAGMFIAGGFTVVLSLVTLRVLDRFERKFFPNERIKVLVLTLKKDSPAKISELKDLVTEAGVRIQSMNMEENAGKHNFTRLTLLVGMTSASDPARLAKTLKNSGVSRVELKEKF